MVEYTKEVYPLLNKSKEGIQHYGYYIYADNVRKIRQWHKPKVSGHVFMTEEEANLEADAMITKFIELNNLPPVKSQEEEIEELKQRITDLENNLRK